MSGNSIYLCMKILQPNLSNLSTCANILALQQGFNTLNAVESSRGYVLLTLNYSSYVLLLTLKT